MHQGIAVLDLDTDKVSFFPESRLPKDARQTYFLGLAFSADGAHLYASLGSLTDPLAKKPGSTGNGIAVYRFHAGRITPERFISIPPQPLNANQHRALAMKAAPAGTAVPFPAGLAVLPTQTGEQLLVACNLSDSVLQLDAATGKILRTFDLSISSHIPASYPYAVVANRAGARAWVTLWNASVVAELDLEKGTVLRRIPVREPQSPTQAGSHPTALLLSPDEGRLYVALANADEVAVISTSGAAPPAFLSTRLRGQKYQGAYPNALAQTADGKRLFVANGGSDAVAVFNIASAFKSDSQLAPPNSLLGFIPTEWYPTALAVRGGDLLIASGRSQGTGPNSAPIDDPAWNNHTYIPALLHGSIARVAIRDAEKNLAALTRDVEHSNLMNGRAESLPFKSGRNPIKHVIYVIKENRTYDQVFGDLGVGDGDASLTMYGEAVTPNQHKLARQFGVLDNFYDSGEVSGDRSRLVHRRHHQRLHRAHLAHRLPRPRAHLRFRGPEQRRVSAAAQYSRRQRARLRLSLGQRRPPRPYLPPLRRVRFHFLVRQRRRRRAAGRSRHAASASRGLRALRHQAGRVRCRPMSAILVALPALIPGRFP